MMSCEHDAKVKFEVFLDRTPVCNPQYSHEASDEASTECCAIQMEHSYSRDTRPTDSKAMATRSILVHKPPPCPSCHQNTTSPCEDMDVDMGDDPDTYPPVPKYNDKAAKEAMESIASIAAKTKNRNSEDDDWEEYIDKLGWSIYQHTLFSKVSDVLTADRLTRLTYANHPQEAILRRTNINKSVQRMRKAFAEVHWDTKLTQWLHGLLVDHMPISYVAAYMDILQTLRTKVPTLVDKMLQGKPTDLTEAVMRPPWKPQVEVKDRKITPEPIILVCPSNLPTHSVNTDSRESQWTTLLHSMTSHVLNVPIPENFYVENGTCPLADYVEQLVTLTRVKLHDIRKEHPQRQIILFGVNAGSSLALQVASLEQNINCVICMGFATSTMKGTRGNLDDRLVELQTPVLFVVGQNSTKTSQEQMEALREQMVAPTALVVVGSADDYLLVPNAKQRLEKVTQDMVDHMVMDEVAEFTSNCISNPPLATKKRLPVNSSATIVILDSPTDSVKTNGGQLGVKKNPKSPVKINRVTKKKVMERAGGTVGKFVQYGSKKEFTDKIALTSSSGQLTNYEIVTGKMKPTAQVLDGSIIQIANDSQQPQKWQVTTSAAPVSRTPVLVPLLQKQKISLGNHFTPMRTSTATDSQLMGVTKPFQVNVKGKKMYSLQATEVTETIELDTDDEIVNLDGATVVDGDVLNATVAELSAGDLSGIPVVFQDSEGNIREPVGSSNPVVVDVGSAPVQSSGTVIVTSQSVIPRPNKYVYYKPQQTSRVQQQSQYVVLSNGGGNDDKMKIVTSTASTGQNVSSKPLIISVESLEKGTPNTVYHVLPDAAEKEE